MLRHAAGFDLGGTPVRARLCDTLQEARDEAYFFEALVSYASMPIPFGDEYDAWRSQIGSEMEEGRGLYYLGR